MSTLAGRRVLLGITGGIAAYKGPLIVRELTAAGATVRVVLSRAAAEFVTPLALQAVSHHAVGVDLFDPTYEQQIGHIELARWPDLILVAPATAHLLARLAHGLCDDLLTTVLTATRAPVVLAPAMNTQMWAHHAVARNVAQLRQDGYHIVPPDSGELACQEVGAGRMPDPPELRLACLQALTPPILRGRRLVITAGPTAEPIDPVRFLTNRSSGKMGYAIAQAAALAGAQVTLVSGPTALTAPWGVQRVAVESAREMRDAVFAHALQPGAQAHAVIKAAAVADYRPQHVADQKIKKTPGPMSLPLERNPDILGELCDLPAPQRPLLVGFAAETQDVERLAAEKLQRKPVDLLVANRVSGPDSAFGADTSSVLFLTPRESLGWFGPAPKETTAAEIVRRVALLLDARPAGDDAP